MKAPLILGLIAFAVLLAFLIPEAGRVDEIKRIQRETAEEVDAIKKRGYHPSLSLEVWRRIAEGGDAEAQNEVGVIFATG